MDQLMCAYKGVLIPKARPKFNTSTGQVYMSPHYTRSKEDVMREMLKQFGIMPGRIKKCELELTLFNQRGDLDNLLGTIMDAMKEGKIVTDDNDRVITAVNMRSVFYEDDFTTGFMIIITPMEYEKPKKVKDYVNLKEADLVFPDV